MKALVQLVAASAGALAFAAMPSCTSTCEEKGTCGPHDGDDSKGGSAGKGTGGSSGASGGTAGSGTGGTSGSAGVGGGGGMGGEGGMGPDPCDPENPVAGCAISDTDGIYVAPTGDDVADGTKDAPLQTINQAITLAAGMNRTIYVCNDSFDEQVVIGESNIVIRGGYACPSASVTGWLYEAGVRARVRPMDRGYALRVQAADNITLSDMDFAARNATEPGESSVAVFVTSSENLSFVRARLVAGDGMAGEDGVLGGTNHFGMSLDGNAATGAMGGATKQCACPDGSKSTGAVGGTGGLTQTDGGKGLPAYDMTGGSSGKGGGTCTNGGNGSPPPAVPDAEGATVVGVIHATNGWIPGSGGNGETGQPGQGGGGGGGGDSLGGKGGGGGGSCGGCGGKGAPGGTGGGASIGLLALNSTITLDPLSLIQTANAGAGGAGDTGETGQGGGTRGTQDGNGCPGGIGGKGAAGGSGGGGAGGISVGIVSKGGTITADDVTFDIGTEGTPGQGGGMDNAGEAGLSENTLTL